MRRSGKLQSILFLLLIIILLAAAAGGVSNLSNSIDKAFNGGGSSSDTTQTTGNGTTIVPVTTAPVTSSLHTHVYSNNGICSCGVACDHLGYRQNAYIPSNDGKNHIYKYKCDLCKVYYYTVGTRSCEDNNNDRKCDLCGGSIAVADTHVHSYESDGYCSCGAECSHDYDEKYVPTGYGSHDVQLVCSICSLARMLDTSAIPCYDFDNDGICDCCSTNIPIQEPEHVHSYSSATGFCSCGVECDHNPVTTFSPLTGGTHSIADVCSICKKGFEGAGIGDCTDSNNDGKCDQCEGSMTE